MPTTQYPAPLVGLLPCKRQPAVFRCHAQCDDHARDKTISLGAAGQPMERERGAPVDHRQGAVFRQDEQSGGHQRVYDGGECARFVVCSPMCRRGSEYHGAPLLISSTKRPTDHLVCIPGTFVYCRPFLGTSQSNKSVCMVGYIAYVFFSFRGRICCPHCNTMLPKIVLPASRISNHSKKHFCRDTTTALAGIPMPPPPLPVAFILFKTSPGCEFERFGES